MSLNTSFSSRVVPLGPSRRNSLTGWSTTTWWSTYSDQICTLRWVDVNWRQMYRNVLDTFCYIVLRCSSFSQTWQFSSLRCYTLFSPSIADLQCVCVCVRSFRSLNSAKWSWTSWLQRADSARSMWTVFGLQLRWDGTDSQFYSTAWRRPQDSHDHIMFVFLTVDVYCRFEHFYVCYRGPQVSRK